MGLTKATNRMTSGAVLNVLDFGAVADGDWAGGVATGTDNSAAFTAALTAATTQKISKVYVPSGSYKLVTGIELPHGITMEGDGTAHQVLYAGNTIRNGSVLLVEGAVGGDCVKFKENSGHNGLRNISIYQVCKFGYTIRYF